MRRLRIAWLGHQSASLGGGMATYSHEIVGGLRRMGHQVTFFHHADPSGEGLEESSESVSLASVNVPLVKSLVLSPGRAKRKLVDRLRQREFDVIHASFWFSSMDFDLPKLTREVGIPLVATFHVAFDNYSTTNSGTDREHHDVVFTYSRTKSSFTPRSSICIILNHQRKINESAQLSIEIDAVPAGNIWSGEHRLPIRRDKTGRRNANTFHFTKLLY